MEYIDLGLPSGTLWAAENEEDCCTFKKATKFKENLPTIEDFEELLKYCWRRWNYEIGGTELMGDNGIKLFLPAAGIRFSDVGMCYVGFEGHYWTSTLDEYKCFNTFFLEKGEGAIFRGYPYFGCSVRLIKRRDENKKL